MGDGAWLEVGAEDAGPGHAESLVLGSVVGRCCFRVGIGLAWRTFLLGKRLTVLVPSSAASAIQDLKVLVSLCRFLSLDWLRMSLVICSIIHYSSWSSFWGYFNPGKGRRISVDVLSTESSPRGGHPKGGPLRSWLKLRSVHLLPVRKDSCLGEELQSAAARQYFSAESVPKPIS